MSIFAVVNLIVLISLFMPMNLAILRLSLCVQQPVLCPCSCLKVLFDWATSSPSALAEPSGWRWRERERRKKIKAREKVEKSRNTVFFQAFGAKAAGVEPSGGWEIKNCTPLWHEAHFQVQMIKTPHVRITFGSWVDQTMHASVVRSACASQNVKKMLRPPAPEHSWKFSWSKNARGCGAKHMLKWKCKKINRSEVRTFFCVASPMGSAPSHMWEKHEGLWQLQKKMAGVGRLKKTCTTPHCTSLHYTRLPCTTPHFNYNYKRNWNDNYATTMQLQVQAQRQLQPQLLHYNYNCICNYNYCCATLHEASATLHCTSLDYIALQPLKLRVQLNYNYNYGFKRNFNYNYTTLRYR